MVILNLRITMPPGREHAVRGEARRLLGPTRARPGCVDCRWLEDIESSSTLMLVEVWKSREQLDAHIRSEQFRVILGLMDLSETEPAFQIHTVTHTAGLRDLIAEEGIG